MKTLFLISTLLFLIVSGFAQTTATGTVFDYDTSTKIWLEPNDNLAGNKKGILVIQIRNKDVYQSKSGQYYIFVNKPDGIDPLLATSQSRYYLGWVAQLKGYENMTVFTNSTKNAYWYFQVGSNNQLRKIYLPTNVFKTQ